MYHQDGKSNSNVKYGYPQNPALERINNNQQIREKFIFGVGDSEKAHQKETMTVCPKGNSGGHQLPCFMRNSVFGER